MTLKTSASTLVLQKMRPGCIYRAWDLQQETGVTLQTTRKALRTLMRGGVVNRLEDGRRWLYATKQLALPLG